MNNFITNNLINNMNLVTRFSLVVVVIFLSQACSNKALTLYEESSYGKPLEVPPDLTKPSNRDDLSFLDNKQGAGKTTSVGGSMDSSGSTCACGNSEVRPAQTHIKIARDGGRRWLEVSGEPRNIWPWIRDFWLKQEFLLTIEDPVIGLIETDWKQQRNNLPMEGPAGNKKVAEQGKVEETIYAVPTREKYRVRLEKGELAATTEIFLSHRGVELLTDGDLIVWKLRASDLELEAEMLTRLAVFLGAERDKLNGPLASTNQHLNIASLTKDESGHPLLKIDIDFSRVWRRIGLVLDRMDFIIEERDRSVGTYHLRRKNVLKDDEVVDEPGFFSGWFSSEGSESPGLQIILHDEGAATHITVQDSAGKSFSDEKATIILKKMINHLQ